VFHNCAVCAIHKPTPLDVGLHHCSSDYTALWLSTRFVWQLLSSWSCCHGDRIHPLPHRPSPVSSQQQRTRCQSPVFVLPGYGYAARFMGHTVTHPHTLPSCHDLRFALLTCGGMMSLGVLTCSSIITQLYPFRSTSLPFLQHYNTPNKNVQL
jgi:hypothetical protein